MVSVRQELKCYFPEVLVNMIIDYGPRELVHVSTIPNPNITAKIGDIVFICADDNGYYLWTHLGNGHHCVSIFTHDNDWEAELFFSEEISVNCCLIETVDGVIFRCSNHATVTTILTPLHSPSTDQPEDCVYPQAAFWCKEKGVIVICSLDRHGKILVSLPQDPDFDHHLVAVHQGQIFVFSTSEKMPVEFRRYSFDQKLEIKIQVKMDLNVLWFVRVDSKFVYLFHKQNLTLCSHDGEMLQTITLPHTGLYDVAIGHGYLYLMKDTPFHICVYQLSFEWQ